MEKNSSIKRNKRKYFTCVILVPPDSDFDLDSWRNQSVYTLGTFAWSHIRRSVHFRFVDRHLGHRKWHYNILSQSREYINKNFHNYEDCGTRITIARFLWFTQHRYTIQRIVKYNLWFELGCIQKFTFIRGNMIIFKN